MLLKRLELQGFKSFADKTVLDFGSGVTSVVGPNGSGKSNISDAIRWVMGEMSAKSLRGANMQDVIFAGTEKRGRLNFAEVSLVLDNSTRVFPLEYDEVVVTRRVFRSGETAYQINRTNCRLKDIHELFMDTGLGRDGYSIIGQGNVSQVLSTKAEERRNLFEEAAGVSKYKYKKEEATRKLSQVEENIIRISDITLELESQLAPLERQSEKARKYLTYYEEYKTLDVNMAKITLDKNEEQTRETDGQNNDVNCEINEIREKESETEAKISKLYDESRNADEEQAEKNNSLIELQSRIMEYTNDISISENTIENNKKTVLRMEGEIEALQKKTALKKETILKLQNECLENEKKMSEAVELLSLVQSEDRDILGKISELSAEISKVREASVEFSGKIASERSKVEGIETLRESYLLRKEALTTQKEALFKDIENTKTEISENKKNIEQKTEKKDKLSGIISSQELKKEELTANLNSLKEEKNKLSVELNSKMSKRKMLSEMENEYDGYSKSVKVILKNDELKKLAIYGTVAGLIEVKKEYTVAIETALGNSLQNIIVETEDDAKEAIFYLRQQNAGRATFLPVSSIKGRSLDNVGEVKKEQGFVGIASDLISCNSKYQEIIKNLLGRVVIVDNIDNGIKMSRKYGYKFRVVTLLGDALNSGGSMSGGSVNKTSGFLSRSAEIKELKTDISGLEIKLRDVDGDISKLDNTLQTLETQLLSYLQMRREYEDEIIRLENSLTHLLASVDGGNNTENSVEKELLELEEKLSVSSDEVAEVLNLIRNAEKGKKEAEEKLLALEEQRQVLEQAREDKNNSLIEANKNLSERRSELDNSRFKIEQLKEDIKNAQEEADKKRTECNDISVANDELIVSIENKKKLSAELETEISSLNDVILKISEKKKEIVESLQKIQSSNKEITDTLLKLQQELSRVEAKQLKLSMERENILSRLWEEYELTYSDIEEIAKEPEDVKEAAQRLAELKAKIKALGSINIDSIEEYKNVSERYNFLSEQKSDLENSRENLNKIIESMEDLMKVHFSEQFSAISESFSTVFKELFGGGCGKLYLQDPDNVLESGIEIEVQLPGKGLQNLNLYSGGEKSFIAIALLFAILRVKPAPFCILDEIDAALDDVNVSRFATYLKNYIDNSQFIVITHRRGTMESANVLYGVTMQEKGVSKLLSLQIDDVDDNMAQ